jgi:hypothetical protein
MNEMDFLEGINGLSPEALEISAPKKAKARPNLKRWIAAAAAALMICGSVTAGAVALHRGVFGPILSGSHGYRAEFELDKFRWKSFKGDITEVPEIIKEQYATFTPAPVYSNTAVLPGVYAKTFGTLAEAVDYIGLDALKEAAAPFSEDVTVSVMGDSRGRIQEIDVSSQHILLPGDPAGFGGFLNVKILTEYSSTTAALTGGDWGDYDPGSIDFKEFTTSKGVLCQYAEIGAGDRDRQMVSGYIVDNGILYNLSVNFDEGGLDDALEMLREWAESFR